MQVSSLTVKNPKCPLVFVFAGGESHFKDGSSKAQDGYGALRLSLNTLCERHEVEIKTEGSLAWTGFYILGWSLLIRPGGLFSVVRRSDAMRCNVDVDINVDVDVDIVGYIARLAYWGVCFAGQPSEIGVRAARSVRTISLLVGEVVDIAGQPLRKCVGISIYSF